MLVHRQLFLKIDPKLERLREFTFIFAFRLGGTILRNQLWRITNQSAFTKRYNVRLFALGM